MLDAVIAAATLDGLGIRLWVKHVASRKVVEVSEGALEVIGLNRDQVVGKTADEYFPVEQASLVRHSEDIAAREGRYQWKGLFSGECLRITTVRRGEWLISAVTGES